MKKITLGSICLFSLVLCSGVRAMKKEQMGVNPCGYKKTYESINTWGWNLNDVTRDLEKHDSYVHGITVEEKKLRSLIRFIARIEKTKLYAINEGNDRIADTCNNMLEQYKKKHKDLLCEAEALRYNGKLPLSATAYIVEDREFLDREKTHSLVWSAEQGLRKTIKFLFKNAKSKDQYKPVFLLALERACARGHLDVVKVLVNSLDTPQYHYGPDGFGTRTWTEYGGKRFWDYYYIQEWVKRGVRNCHRYYNDDEVMFYDDAFSCAVKNGHVEIAIYFLTNERTKHKISDHVKVQSIIDSVQEPSCNTYNTYDRISTYYDMNVSNAICDKLKKLVKEAY